MILPSTRKRNGSGKLYRSASNEKSGKYKRQFLRTVKRTGKWRGKKADLYS